MIYVGLSLLGLLFLTLFIIWHKWGIFLHYYDKKLLIELRSSIYHHRLFYRDFSAKPNESPSQPSGDEEKGKSTLQTRFADNKKRIYNPEGGGFSFSGLHEAINDYRNLYDEIKEVLHPFLDDLRYKVDISSVWIKVDYGTGNPACTGILYSTIWGIVGMIHPTLSRYFHIEQPAIEINPDYYNLCFNLEFKGIIKVKPSHIIIALLKQNGRQVITYYKKNFTKGSVKNG